MRSPRWSMTSRCSLAGFTRGRFARGRAGRSRECFRLASGARPWAPCLWPMRWPTPAATACGSTSSTTPTPRGLSGCWRGCRPAWGRPWCWSPRRVGGHPKPATGCCWSPRRIAGRGSSSPRMRWQLPCPARSWTRPRLPSGGWPGFRCSTGWEGGRASCRRSGCCPQRCRDSTSAACSKGPPCAITRHGSPTRRGIPPRCSRCPGMWRRTDGARAIWWCCRTRTGCCSSAGICSNW